LVKSGILDCHIHYCKIDKSGFVDEEYLKYLLAWNHDRPTLVSIQMANNEIGTIQNIKRISNIVHQCDGILHVDATQALPCIPIDVEELGIDMMSCSGHKLSPVLKGIGFLYKKNCINIQPIIYGAQENGLRGGTENTYGIIGLNKALEYCDVTDEKFESICEKADYFIEKLKSKFGCRLNGHDTFRLPNNINVVFPQNITGESLLYMLDLSGIKCSVGSACNSESIEPSHVLKAIGLSDEEAMKTVRFSLSDDMTYQDIDYVIKEIDKAIKILETI
jgi:cysteine desulfurase